MRVRLQAAAAATSLLLFLDPAHPAQQAVARGHVEVTFPESGAVVTGPTRIRGTYTDAFDIFIAFDAGFLHEVHTHDPQGDDDGTWHFDWDPAEHAGPVEIAVRGTSTADLHSRWALPVTVTVHPRLDPSSTPSLHAVPAGPRAVGVLSGGSRSESASGHRLDPAARALWVWESATQRLLTTPGARRVLAAFMDDPAVAPDPRRVLYLYADRGHGGWMLKDRPELYRSLIAWAHGRGWSVHALLGSGAYLAPMYSYERFHHKAVALMDAVLVYNVTAPSEARFDGVNIDIEPYVLPDWRHAPSVKTQYFDMLAAMMERKAASGQRLLVGPAIPRWLDDSAECRSISWRGARKTCAQHVQDIADYVALMDYRDVAGTSVGIIDQARGEIDYGNRIGKPVVIGVETGEVSSGDPETISFHEEGRTWMEAELARVMKAFAGEKSFGGIAVHHYDSWRTMRTVWSPGGVTWSSPVADSAPPAAPAGLSAAARDWQRIDLGWEPAADDVMVDHYEIHRSNSPDFEPDSSTLVNRIEGEYARDPGLLAGTTYRYRIIAVDIAGKRGPASAEVAATTPTGAGRRRMRIASIAITPAGSGAQGTLTLTDDDGRPVEGATVSGKFGGAAGRTFSGVTDASGVFRATSEDLHPPWTVIFAPRRIRAAGYYWASSLDVSHAAESSHTIRH